MKTTITQKRAELYREFILATLANDEIYYEATLSEGIPDGDEPDEVLADLADGFYDDDIDNMIDVYCRARRRYGKYGYYVFETRKLYTDENEALTAAGYKDLPERIYMKHR